MKASGWAIKGNFGFYVGWWFTRKEAIKYHCEAVGKDWAYCKKKGDSAVKVTIQEVKQ